MTDKKFEWEMGHSGLDPERPEAREQIPTAKNRDPLVGQMLDGRFLIQQDLTEDGGDTGGIGMVYLALDMKLMGKETVVKILRRTLVQNEDIVRKFLHEKEALIRLDHPNIVRILDSGDLSDGNPFMVIEYIPGYSLRRVLKTTKKQPFDFIAHIVERTTDALNAAHSQKILHRDIKPENIMLTPREDDLPRVRLIDFGIARVGDSRLAPATEIPRGIGTILYIAPEQLLGNLEQSPAVDIYAFAIVIYEMLTGELPFQPQSIVEMFELQKKPVQIPPSQLREDLPAEAEKILLSALAFDPAERPQNARQFGRELAAALRHDRTYRSGSRREIIQLAETVASAPGAERIIIQTSSNPSIVTIETAPEQVEAVTVSPLVPAPEKTSGRVFWGALIGAVVLFALVALGGIFYWTGSPDKASAPTVPPAERLPQFDANTSSNQASSTTSPDPLIGCRYYLIVQKVRNGKPFEEPFRASGQEIFENGYKFKMVIETNAAGYLYLYNQDRDQAGKQIFNLLYPTPKINDGSAQIFTAQPAETSFNTFTGSRGTELVWLIWATERIDPLEVIKETALTEGGIVSAEKDLIVLNEFLQKNQDPKKSSRKDAAAQETVLESTGRILVHPIELEHR